MFKGIASRALGVFVLFTIVCGLGYTLVVTGVAQLAFPYQANGSLITVDGKVVGSELIARTSMTKPICGVVSRTYQLSKAKTASSWRMVPRPTCPRRVRSIGS